MALDSMQEIFEKMQEGQKPFWKVVQDTDVEERQVSPEASFEKMRMTWKAMLETVDTYRGDLRSLSGLVGLSLIHICGPDGSPRKSGGGGRSSHHHRRNSRSGKSPVLLCRLPGKRLSISGRVVIFRSQPLSRSYFCEKKRLCHQAQPFFYLSSSSGSTCTAAVSYTHLDVYKRQAKKPPMTV